VSQELSAEQINAVSLVEKLLRTAGRSPEEAAIYHAKAQQVMLDFNLDLATVEQNSGESGKRMDAMLKGGHFEWQRDLWRDVASLNFCMYFATTVYEKKFSWAPNKTNTGMVKVWREQRSRRHQLIGRMVNVKSAEVMAQYLEQSIDRILRQRLGEKHYGLVQEAIDQRFTRSQLYGKWANSYREGAAEAIQRKLRARRQEQLNEERAKVEKAAEEARQRGFENATTATAVTIASFSKSEKIANYDFKHGEGAWARAEAADVARRERSARYLAEMEAARARRIANDPEYAARLRREAEEDAKREARNARKRERYYEQNGYRRAEGPSYKGDWSARRAGYEDGHAVSIDLQTGGTKTAGAIG